VTDTSIVADPERSEPSAAERVPDALPPPRRPWRAITRRLPWYRHTATAPASVEPEDPSQALSAAPDGDDHRSTHGAVRTTSRWTRVIAFGVLPVLAMALGVASAYFKYQDGTLSEARSAGVEAASAASQIATAMLSYTPDKAEAELTVVRDQLTGPFRDSYTSLTNDVVIPGAKQGQVSATATIPAVATLSAAPTQASVLLFVDQTIVMGAKPPTQNKSVVRVTMQKVDNRWLVSGFEPI
jgi:Mce-associated membrane protein